MICPTPKNDTKLDNYNVELLTMSNGSVGVAQPRVDHPYLQKRELDGDELSILNAFLFEPNRQTPTHTNHVHMESNLCIEPIPVRSYQNAPVQNFTKLGAQENVQNFHPMTTDTYKTSPFTSQIEQHETYSHVNYPESYRPHQPTFTHPHIKKSKKLCQHEGCHKRARSLGFCISHGGGRRCSKEGCNNSSQSGGLCITHGGGRRCIKDGCSKAAQSRGLCKAHGGGPRCTVSGCDRSSQGGGLCRAHGGGRRCKVPGCMKGIQRRELCALHGGSRTCSVPGCTRNDRGGGKCAAHGGGRRCTVEGCDKPCRRQQLCSAHWRVKQRRENNDDIANATI